MTTLGNRLTSLSSDFVRRTRAGRWWRWTEVKYAKRGAPVGTAGRGAALGEQTDGAGLECGAPIGQSRASGRLDSPRSGPPPFRRRRFPQRASTPSADAGHWPPAAAPSAPAPVPGGVQRPQRLAGELVRAEEEHPPGRLLADSGAPAVLPARAPAEPGQRSPLGARSPARAATHRQRPPAASHQHPHRSRGRPTLRRRVGVRVCELSSRGGARKETRWAGPVWWRRGRSGWRGRNLPVQEPRDFCCIYLHDLPNLPK